MKKLFILLVCLLPVLAQAQMETSVAGFIPLSGSGRIVYNFNPGWRFHRGDIKGAEAVRFDDTSWQVVSVPHTVELMPAEASGCRNYQGVAWYRKHFVIPQDMKGKEVSLHFEGAMGKQVIYLNGKRVQEHLGGYLPFTVQLTEQGVQPGDSCLLAVMTDNSDDKNFPPGKRQYTLDFAYHGGIYRDVWMIGKSSVAITDALEADKVAGGGVFVHFDNISGKKAEVYVDTEVHNSGKQTRTVAVETVLVDAGDVPVKRVSQQVKLQAGESKTVRQRFAVRNPKLWSPDSPYLYRIQSRVKAGHEVLDGGVTRVGIRKAEFKGKDGFWLNGKPFGQLVGANRHQDFAYVGNALPNSQQWRDAKRLRDAGCTIIRVAHYPQDPAFMDACDEMGLFVIVATPGWQYWNKNPEFAKLVHRNTREMIRRDRNHPSVLMWEPILNETPYPRDFALEALRITREEFPYPGRPVAMFIRKEWRKTMMWCTDGREMMRRQTVRNNVFLLVSLARMWMIGMHIIIITVPAVAGGNARCWCRRCHYQRVMMKCTALQGSLSVGRNGILLTISGGIIPIRISGAFMMRSVSLNTLIMLFAASLPRH